MSSDAVLPSEETGLALEACMRIMVELKREFGVAPPTLYTGQTQEHFLARGVLRATFGTSNRNRLQKMKPATFLQHAKDFPANLLEAKLARLQHRKPDWRGSRHDEAEEVF